MKKRVISPQDGKQREFLESSADVAIYGGSAGGGKSYAALLEPLKKENILNPKFGAVIFRREMPQIKATGGLWDESQELYSLWGAIPKMNPYEWIFPSGAKVSFSHIQYEKDLLAWDGSQITLIIFDELQHFTEKQFWYMFSRNRSVCGIKPYIRATCNPRADSFVKNLISWYLDEKTGYAIEERSGVIRYFVRLNEELKWADTKQKLFEKYKNTIEVDDIKSFTFIRSKLTDNKILMERDKGYIANLRALQYVERERLLNGNWNVRPAAGLYFQKSWFKIIERSKLPEPKNECRGWDLAATDKVDNEKANFTVAIKMMVDEDGLFYITNMYMDQVSPLEVEKKILYYAEQDGTNCYIRLPQDPGQAGKAQANYFARLLSGYPVQYRTMKGDKVTRARAVSAACENGLIYVLEDEWNQQFFDHVEAFPPEKGSPDIVDAMVETHHQLVLPVFKIF